MKKYLLILSVLALVACNNSTTKEKNALEAAAKEETIRQRTQDSITTANLEADQNNMNSGSQSEESASEKGMNNKTKGALIGAGTGIVAGAATGAIVSENKGKGAIIGGVIGGAVGTGVGYGIGAEKDKKKGE